MADAVITEKHLHQGALMKYTRRELSRPCAYKDV